MRTTRRPNRLRIAAVTTHFAFHTDSGNPGPLTSRKGVSQPLNDMITTTRNGHKSKQKVDSRRALLIANTIDAALNKVPVSISAKINRDSLLTSLLSFDSELRCVNHIGDTLHDIDHNLFLNLSNIKLGEAELSLLRRGVQFAISGSKSKRQSVLAAERCARTFIFSLSVKLALAEHAKRDATTCRL